MNNLKNIFLVALLLNNFACKQSVEKLKEQAAKAYQRGDYQTAFNLWEKACNASDAWSCNNLGFLYAEGQGVKQDYSKSKNFYEKACNAGLASGCNSLETLKSR